MPQGAWDDKTGLKLEDFGRHWADKVAPVLVRDAAEQVRRAALPQKPEDYKVAVSANFKPPEGVEFKLDEADPHWGHFRTWAHRNGVSQDAAHELIDIFGGYMGASEQKVAAARNAEIQKLGATGVARIQAIETFLDAAGVGDLKARIFTGKDVAAFERLIARMVSQGAAPMPQGGREPPDIAGRVSAESYDKMSAGDRFNYARQHDQKNMPAWRDPRAA